MNETPITVTVSQLLYSRVEPAYSAQNKGGFQTVYKTPSLLVQEVTAIEGRIQSFAPLNPAQVRYQFFRLESGSFVIAHSCRIESHPAITDAERRSGAFIAHCLVLTPTELAKVQNNPLALLTNFSFLRDPMRMVECFGQATGIASSATLSLTLPLPTPIAQWDNKEIGKWVALAENAIDIQKRPQSIQLLGTQAEMLAALTLVFALMRPPTRLLCSFDTFAENVAAKPGDYWAMGRSQRQERFLYTVNATQRRIEGQTLPSLPDKDLYLAWLQAALPKQTAESILQKTPSLQAMSDSFATQTPALLEQVDAAIYDEFMGVHRAFIAQRLQETFAQFVRPELAIVVASYALEHWPLPSNLQIAARHQLEARQAADLLLGWVEEAKPQLHDKEWQQLQSLARQADNILLLYLAASLCKKPDQKTQRAALARMDTTMFEHVLAWLFNPIPPTEMVTPVHLQLLVHDKRLETMTGEQLVRVLEAFVAMGEVGQLDMLTQYVNRLNHQELAQVEKQLKKISSAPKQFIQAVQLHREQLGNPKSFLQRFLWRE